MSTSPLCSAPTLGIQVYLYYVLRQIPTISQIPQTLRPVSFCARGRPASITAIARPA